MYFVIHEVWAFGITVVRKCPMASRVILLQSIVVTENHIFCYPPNLRNVNFNYKLFFWFGLWIFGDISKTLSPFENNVHMLVLLCFQLVFVTKLLSIAFKCVSFYCIFAVLYIFFIVNLYSKCDEQI